MKIFADLDLDRKLRFLIYRKIDPTKMIEKDGITNSFLSIIIPKNGPNCAFLSVNRKKEMDNMMSANMKMSITLSMKPFFTKIMILFSSSGFPAALFHNVQLSSSPVSRSKSAAGSRPPLSGDPHQPVLLAPSRQLGRTVHQIG